MDPMETSAIHQCKWRFIGAIGVNRAHGCIDDPLAPFASLMHANGVNGAIENIGDPLHIGANGDSLASLTPLVSMTIMAPMTPEVSLISMCNSACEKWRTHRHSMVPQVPISPLVPMSPLVHQLSLDILTFTSPRNGANGAI